MADDLQMAPDPSETKSKKEYKAPMKAAEAEAKGINPKLVKNKVFLQDWDPTIFGLTEQEIIKFQEIYAMADNQNLGYLGRRQFTDLLKLLNIVVGEVGYVRHWKA